MRGGLLWEVVSHGGSTVAYWENIGCVVFCKFMDRATGEVHKLGQTTKKGFPLTSNCFF